MVGDVLYISTPLSQIAAIDAATGETLWVHDPRSYASGIPTMMLGFSNRGLAYWTDGVRERLIMGTGDAYLIAVDARSGDPVLAFGDQGRVDLMDGIPRARRSPPPMNYSITSAPIMCGDVVIVGSAISDQPRLREAPPGQVRGFDEKSQIQALDRTQPGLPLKKGRAGTMTHDYKRHGTTTLFAALNVATGHVIHECMPRHRHQEFLKFIKTVERSVDPDLEIHVILDNTSPKISVLSNECVG